MIAQGRALLEGVGKPNLDAHALVRFVAIVLPDLLDAIETRSTLLEGQIKLVGELYEQNLALRRVADAAREVGIRSSWVSNQNSEVRVAGDAYLQLAAALAALPRTEGDSRE